VPYHDDPVPHVETPLQVLLDHVGGEAPHEVTPHLLRHRVQLVQVATHQRHQPAVVQRLEAGAYTRPR
jgi:hypothetical protein